MLAGFHAIDEHFRTAPFEREPAGAAWALLGVWYRDFLGAQTEGRPAVRASTSKRFPAYLQQLDMESNGKSVTLDGEPVGYDTGPIVLGRAGHERPARFYQLIHQGTTLDPGRLHRLRPRPRIRSATTTIC